MKKSNSIMDGIAADWGSSLTLSDFAQPWTEEDEKEYIESREQTNKNNTDKQILHVVSDSTQSI
jgi:hypothetical protein